MWLERSTLLVRTHLKKINAEYDYEDEHDNEDDSELD